MFCETVHTLYCNYMLAYFQEFFEGGGGKIYCYTNLFCYANSSIVFRSNFREANVFEGGQMSSKGGNCMYQKNSNRVWTAEKTDKPRSVLCWFPQLFSWTTAFGPGRGSYAVSDLDAVPYVRWWYCTWTQFSSELLFLHQVHFLN